MIFHERLSEGYCDFLPDREGLRSAGYYTTAFLVPTSSVPKWSPAFGRPVRYVGQLFMHPESQRTIRHTVTSPQLELSPRIQDRFDRAMRVLGVWPSFQLSRIEPWVSPVTRGSVLLDICSCNRPACRCLQESYSDERIEMLEDYVAEATKCMCSLGMCRSEDELTIAL